MTPVQKTVKPDGIALKKTERSLLGAYEDAQGTRVVIEVKVGAAKDSAIGQIARYLGWDARTESKPPRGILIAGDFSEAVRYAASAIPDLMLVTYRVQFSFEEVSV